MAASDADHRPLNILLVEDHIGHSELILRAVDQGLPGTRVNVVRTLCDACKFVSTHKPDIALVGSELADGRGVELLQETVEAPGYPVVILSACGNERDAVEALKAGALDYVVKSETLFADIVTVVRAAIREWTRQQQQLTAERVLRANEERFRNLIEGSIQGILIGRGWKALFANQALADILGFDSPAEIVALESTESLFAPEERERLHSYHQMRLNGEGAPTHYEFQALRKDGSPVSLQNVVRLVSWEGEPAVQSVVIDISDRKRVESQLQHQIELQEMITNISSRFINLASTEIEDGVQDALREIGEFCDVDRAYVVLFSENYRRASLRFEWCCEGIASLRSSLQNTSTENQPWFVEKHRRGQLIYAPRVENLPPEAEREIERLHRQGVKSLVSLPLVSKGEVIGYFGFDSVREEKYWTEDIISILTIVGESFANALDRQTAEQDLRRSEQRFKDFADIAADWFWEMGPDLRYTYLSERYQDLLGVIPETHVGLSMQEIFSGRVEDQDVWRAYLENLHARKPVDVELAWTRNDGVAKIIRHIGRPRLSGTGKFLGYRGVGRDVTEAHKMTAQIAHQASHDALTGLVNRREFEQRLARAVANAQAHGAQYVLGYIDLDRFKLVNDVAGHAAGDELLKRVAKVLNKKIRGRDTLARLGGDEFSLLLENCPLEKALEITDGMLSEIRSFHFAWQDRTFDIGLSVGLVSVNVHAESASRELAKADLACYTAKRLGKNRVHVYRMEDAELERRQSDVRRISDLRDALANDQFRLFSQPICSLTNTGDSPTHHELLIRMVSAEGELVLPEVFIPAAERYGLMASIDRWVIHNAFRLATAWLQVDRETMLAINLSGNSLNDESLLEFVLHEFEVSGMPPNQICFEITETAAVSNFDRTTTFISELKRQGSRFALDDFGSGVSSFTYLKHLPVDYLKIDGSFVQDLAHETVDRAMVAAIHQVGQMMGLKTIAERADSTTVVQLLRELGIDYVQGDAVGTAVPLDELLTQPLAPRPVIADNT